jgi:predicted acylesterase/phospholipase RssA
MYESRGNEIFGSPRSKFGSLLGGPKYDARGLEKTFDEFLPKAKLSEALIEVFIMAYDLERRRPRAFKRWRAKEDIHQDVSLKDIACATSAAPTYFPPAVIENRGFIDGGVVANNPALAGYAEAIRLWPKNDVLIVSIGTGAADRPIPTAAAKSWGQAKWVVPLIDCMLSGSSDAVHYAMQQLVPATRYQRFQINLSAGSESMDDASPANLSQLRKLGDDLVQQYSHELSELVSLLVKLDGAGPTAPLSLRPRPQRS